MGAGHSATQEAQGFGYRPETRHPPSSSRATLPSAMASRCHFPYVGPSPEGSCSADWNCGCHTASVQEEQILPGLYPPSRCLPSIQGHPPPV